jgi:hypothetical protein
MPLFSIFANGKTTIVDAPSKSAAGAYASKIVETKVELAGAADLKDVDFSAIPVVLKGGHTQADLDAAEQAKTAREAKTAEKAPL